MQGSIAEMHFGQPTNHNQLLERIAQEKEPQKKAILLVQLADNQSLFGNFVGSLQSLKEASIYLPNNFDLLLRRARANNLVNNWRGSVALLTGIQDNSLKNGAYWLCLADSYRHGRQWKQVECAARAGLKVVPQSKRLALLLACASAYLSNWDEAKRWFIQSGDSPEAFEMYAAATAHCGHLENATTLLEQGLSLFPENCRLLSAIGMLKWMAGDRSSYADAARDALKKNPSNLAVLLTLADLCRRGDRQHDALEILEKSATSNSPPELKSALGLMHSICGDMTRASHLALESSREASEKEWIRRNSAVIHLSADDPIKAAEHCNWGLSRNNLDQEWIALDAMVQRLLGNSRYFEVYDYKKFVKIYDLKAKLNEKDGSDTFNRLVDHVRGLHIYSNHPLDQTLRNGVQYPIEGQDRESGELAKFFSALKGPVEDYLRGLKKSVDHPFECRNSGDFEVAGAWTVWLKSGGRHVNHIHPEGWISAVCYLDLPPRKTSETNPAEGDLCFGEPNFKSPKLTSDYFVVPKVGEVVFFPSYMWHGTMPINDDAQRLTLAFDLIPA